MIYTDLTIDLYFTLTRKEIFLKKVGSWEWEVGSSDDIPLLHKATEVLSLLHKSNDRDVIGLGWGADVDFRSFSLDTADAF